MKKNWMLFLFFAAFAALTFSGCSDDDNSDVPENTHLVSKEVQAAFNAKYPQAKDVEWELKGDYACSRFLLGWWRAFCMVQSVIGCLVYDRNRCSL